MPFSVWKIYRKCIIEVNTRRSKPNFDSCLLFYFKMATVSVASSSSSDLISQLNSYLVILCSLRQSPTHVVKPSSICGTSVLSIIFLFLILSFFFGFPLSPKYSQFSKTHLWTCYFSLQNTLNYKAWSIL